MDSSNDPRTRLVSEKFFSLRPKPLERWIWQRDLPASAERVFWLHWEEGMRNRDWCSEIPVRRVARECCVDVSTVSRAYQLLRAKGLIRREDPGRDPANPFQQATAITEVRVPRELLLELDRFPSRAQRSGTGSSRAKVVTAAAPVGAVQAPAAADSSGLLPRRSRQEIQALWARLSSGESVRYYRATREGTTYLEFDADTKLNGEDRAFILTQLHQMAATRISVPMPPKCVRQGADPGVRRRLSPLEIARARRSIATVVPTARDATEILRQVLWAVEEGALRQFETLKGLNIALKKIREGAWTPPNRMPPNWRRGSAMSELCSAA